MGQPLIRIPQVRQKLEAMTVWLPVVDAFRTLAARRSAVDQAILQN
jgi:hypothetical protein